MWTKLLAALLLIGECLIKGNYLFPFLIQLQFFN